MAVDNESHVVASVAAACGLPMTAVRVIVDPASREIPASAMAAVCADGSIDLAALGSAAQQTTHRIAKAAEGCD